MVYPLFLNVSTKLYDFTCKKKLHIICQSTLRNFIICITILNITYFNFYILLACILEMQTTFLDIDFLKTAKVYFYSFSICSEKS